MPDDLKSPEGDAVRDDLMAAFEAAEKQPETGRDGAYMVPDDDWKRSEPVGDQPDKAKPEASTEEKAPDKPRDEKGRFAPKDVAPEGDKAKPEQAAAEKPSVEKAKEVAPQEPKPETEPVKVEGAPPPGWSIKSKAAWDSLPDHIRADIVKREQEVNAGFAALRDFKDLKPYADMAKQSGTTLSAALHRYTNMEQALRRDPARGLMAVAHNVGLSQGQAAQLFATLAQQLGANPIPAASPSNGRAAQPSTNGVDQHDPLVEVVRPIIDSAMRPVAEQLNALYSQMTTAQQANQTAKAQAIAEAVAEFEADPKHRYFPDLEETIIRLFQSGMVAQTGNHRRDLEMAYEQALWMHPEVRETLINERKAATEAELRAKAEKEDQEKRAKAEAARNAAVSVRGAPSGPAAVPQGSRGSVRDDLEAAFSAWS